MFDFRRTIASLCTVCLLLTLLCGIHVSADDSRPEADYTGRIVDLSLNEDGYFSITRERAKNEPMGEKDSWTIFVYMSGSDLETEDGLASGDIEEMIEGSKGSAVRYVVLTGGALEWHNPMIDSSLLQIFLIENGTMTEVASRDYRYMNDPKTLQGFLHWGIGHYPADKMGVVFWDHGGASLAGVCIDQHFDQDVENGVLEDLTGLSSTLTLPAISEVFSLIYDEMTDQFEFIGYDACLMGTFENAYMVSPYARYLYASEESEPGYGWDYTAIGQAIGSSGAIGGAELGVVVSDSFYASCKAADQEKDATFACIDLRYMDDLALAFDTFARELLDASEDPVALSFIQRSVNHVDFFGGNIRSEGYFNSIDLAGFVTSVSLVDDAAQQVLDALDQAVVYCVNGIHHRGACGLAVYYPLHVEPGSGELGRYAEVAFSPYYYGYVAQNAYAGAKGTMDGYDLKYSLDVWSSTVDPNAETIVEHYSTEEPGENALITFYDGPRVLDNGTYGFSVTLDSIPYISRIEADIFFLTGDGEELLYLGSTVDINADWEGGIFTDRFNHWWFCMPDGQPIAAFYVSLEDDYAIYSTPVMVNGEESNLRLLANIEDGSVQLGGVWKGSDESGLSDRIDDLQPGDVIQPLFYGASLTSDEEITRTGNEYVYDGSTLWQYDKLFDARYLYDFCIYDIYGGSITTEGVYFIIDGDSMTYEVIQ